ncbi:rhodanese-like domain-containing protein [Pusillimonas sp. CC-YST705]|uniref:Rhodanese-like domain-containing protein n=2 Tax=Mesopusillimonas faecipullorum TaxID=2755040 RepID=A0ABS8CC10_9BURK|nr:rhodanese-like domain-containing protein [Mesopusillimonas faecipullorum]
MLLWPTLRRGKGGPVSVSDAVQTVNRNQGVFVDVRPPDQFKTGTIAQARNVPVADLGAKAGSLPKNKPLIVFCEQGRESIKAAALLRKQGLDAVSLEGGLKAWTQAGMPLSKKA